MVADLAGGEWPQRARNAAKRITEDAEGEEDDIEGVRLLHDISDIFERENGDFIQTDHLLQYLLEQRV
jgi:Protein of unknown function (DUF3631)